MKFIIQSMAAILVAFSVSACTSQITTESSLITTLYVEEQPAVMEAFKEVVQSMDKYEIKSSSPSQIVVKYDPDGLLMGSAKVQVDFQVSSGFTSDGRTIKGVEITYTDVTGLFSQDSAFDGADIIDRLTFALNEYMDFKEVKHARVTLR